MDYIAILNQQEKKIIQYFYVHMNTLLKPSYIKIASG